MTTRTAYTADTLTSSSISSDEKKAFSDPSALKCPATGKTYEYQAPRDGASRSVCPALNTMANHGYIPRDGKDISYLTLVRGLKKCYGLTTPLALFLAAGGFFLIKKFTSTDLFNFGKHGGVEHDASLVHRDTPPNDKYGPIAIVPEWVPEIVGDIEPKVEVDAVNLDTLINEEDIGRSRVRREKHSPPLDAVHAELARGEMAIIMGVWETKNASKTGIPVPHLLQWLQHERLPEGWKPTHKQGLRDVRRRSKLIKKTMDAIRAEEEQSEKTK